MFVHHVPPIRVREATLADAPVLAELNAEFNGPEVRGDQTAQRLTQCADLERALIAEVDAVAVGFASVRIVPALADDHPHATLTELFVRPAWRRRGIGRSLVEHAEARARAADAENLALLTSLDNHVAQAFYRGLGYRDWALALRRSLRDAAGVVPATREKDGNG